MMRPVPWFWVIRATVGGVAAAIFLQAHPDLTGWRWLLAVVCIAMAAAVTCDLLRSGYQRAQRDVIADRKSRH